MRASQFRKLLLVLKYFLSSSNKLLKDARTRLLQTFAFLWKILRRHLQIGTRRKGNGGPSPTDTPTNIRTTQKRNNVTDITDSRNFTTSTSSTTTPNETIPLDSSIACSLTPYPYLNNLSMTSVDRAGALSAARSTHSAAVASRNASRTTQRLYLHTGSQDSQEGYTFSVKSPDYQPTPISQRQYSTSLPQLGGPSAVGPRPPFFDDVVHRTHSSSPAASITGATRPASDVGTDWASTQDEMPNLAHDRIFPIVPEFFQRYTRAIYVEAKDTELTIKALTFNYKSHEDPPGWKPILHPEGVLYFYNESKKVVTEANLYERKFYKQIMEDITTLEEFVSAHHITLPEPYTIAMDLNEQEEGTIYTDYYYADHTRKTLFFLDDLDAPTNLTVWREVKGITSLDHIRHEMESQYWYHGMLYPSTTPVVAERVADLRDIILHYIGDATTSHFSTSPYNLSDLNSMLSHVNSLEKNIGSQFLGASSLLCRMMLVFSRQRFYNWHGLPSARIHRDQSVHGKRVKKRTLLIKILSPLLFSAPDTHLNNLERMWVDGIMHGATWLESTNKLSEEWQEFILYATVLLNANVAFLAIQSIDTQVKPYRSPTQISSYLSTVSSIGSIILGLLLMRQNRTRAHGTANDVCAFLQARSHPTLGLETLAILYSLPYALLLWGMVSFLAAFAWNCFDDSTIPTRTIMGSAWVAFAVLVLWCIWMGWVKGPEPDTDPEVEVAESPSVKDEHDHQDDASVTSHRGEALGRGSGGRAVALLKNLHPWSWPRRLIVKVRRASLDSDDTAVHANV